uniref:Phosphatase tensin-type domain-containing protein n=1 Tax=Electrophorus electricus TaxID=8005 RepID=A0A4W4DPX0_ELEEL
KNSSPYIRYNDYMQQTKKDLSSTAEMAAEPEFDLSYITERIIAVSFHSTCPEQTYLRNLQNITQMLQSKHADNYLVVNISEPREELRRMSTRVLDVGWPELRAPSLHLLCSLCKSMENWLDTCSEHVLLLHCRGNKDRIGVVISSYIQLPSVSTSEEQALDRYTMKRFYSDKMASLMTPSQKRQAFSSEHTCIRTFQQRCNALNFHEPDTYCLSWFCVSWPVTRAGACAGECGHPEA